ncbi:glycosyltransferase family 2 protein [Pseudoflavonifractor capillosus]|uniref:glycosyltransferase family 2 protein n=1 Tax=Pseudoflavonifractor capillosus TaxID=106588 RepID=UPI001957486C|nr:glycosyltransferase family 2 protein [Pseudoflavonifractor capillosus]MBM6896673.1 glycosyltransferase family 2 protein [Pseudoflavonifractor capillosus]
MLMMLQRFCGVLTLMLAVLYVYQAFYVIVGLVRRKRPLSHQAQTFHRYAVLISARNEEEVIGELIESLKNQDYPKELLDVYVIADNCTDATAQVAREAGAIVLERFDRVRVGKGYAMDWFFHKLEEQGKGELYDGYFVFDADNIVDPAFVREMNNVFDSGDYAALTCYRNSKNYASNWISAGYSLWFLREARFLNFARMEMGTGCAVSGTGFLVSAQVVRENGGWPYHLLTEDIQFSIDCAVQGRRIGYCDKAVVYDEQPTTFQQSWTQRMRWSKGFYQVAARYLGSLFRGCFTQKKGRFTCYDMMMTVAPGMLLTTAVLGFNAFIVFSAFTEPMSVAGELMQDAVLFLLDNLFNFYICMLIYGGMTLLVEWKQVNARASRKILYLFTFPLFMLTYIPISLAALVRRVEWKPIRHNSSASLKAKNGSLT